MLLSLPPRRAPLPVLNLSDDHPDLLRDKVWSLPEAAPHTLYTHAVQTAKRSVFVLHHIISLKVSKYSPLVQRNTITLTICPTPLTVLNQFSPDVVIPAEDHAAFRVARRADLPQLCLAARTLQAAAVPVAVHGIEEEAVGYFASTAGAPLPRQRARADCRWLATASGIHHHLNPGSGKKTLICLAMSDVLS